MVTAHPSVRKSHKGYRPVVILTGNDRKPRTLPADAFTYSDKGTARNVARHAAHKLKATHPFVIIVC